MLITTKHMTAQSLSYFAQSALQLVVSKLIKGASIICISALCLNTFAHDKNQRFESNNSAFKQTNKLFNSQLMTANQNGVKQLRSDSNIVYFPGLAKTRFVSNDTDTDTFEPGNIYKNPTGTIESSSCMLDFDDFDAMNLLGYAPEGFLPYAKDTFTWSPWYHQACTATKYVAVRPIDEIHYHLAFEDPDIKPCPGGPSLTEHYIVHDDGTCEDFDPREKPRFLMPHNVDKMVKIFVHEGNGPIVFGLNSIKVMGEADIDLCYKPTGPWKAIEPAGENWICWEDLHNGVWNFSGLITETTQIRINAHNFDGLFKVDDIDLNIQ